jgi:MarR family transcriptional regulator, transcriptional regulator for hemolysin
MEIGRQLAYTAKLSREFFERRLAEHGGSLATWIVLSAAVHSPTSLSQRELADRMAIGGPTLVRHLDRLEADGLVARRRDDHDRRVTRIDLTPAGRRRYDELAAVSAETNAEVRALMTEDEERILRSVLQRVAAHVHAADEQSEHENEEKPA